MHNYLEGYLSTLPESQRQILIKFLTTEEDLSGKSEAELEQTIRDIIENIGYGESVMKYREMSGKTNSSAYNAMLSEIRADLYSLYAESNRTDRLIGNSHQLNLSVLKSIEKELDRIEKKIEVLNLLADNAEGYSSASRDPLIDGSMMESYDPSLYTDRNGTSISSNNMGVIGNSQLYMAASNERNVTAGATIKILEQTGEGFRGNTSHGIEMAIDQSSESFWGEVILADESLKVPMGEVTEGAVCKFKIEFLDATTVSEIAYNPYTEFPLEIVSIGYTTDTTDNIVGYVKPYDTSNTMKITRRTVIKFPAVTCRGLIFTIRQEHATRNTYLVTKSQISNAEMWQKIATKEADLTLSSTFVGDSDEETVNPQLKSIDVLDPAWAKYKHSVNVYNDMLNSWGPLAGIIKLFSPEPQAPEKIQVDKFEYVYGAYDISCISRDYVMTSVYVSKPHMIDGNVQQVVLEANESHPLFYDELGETITKQGSSDPIRRTSVEYYVAPKSDPGPNDWFPILPLGQTHVNNEVLIMSTGHLPVAVLRWPADDPTTCVLYKDEERLQYGYDWDFEPGSTQIVRIKPHTWNTSSIYTMDYYPAGQPDVVDFGQVATPVGITEEFPAGTDKDCSILLKHYPYVDRSKLGSLSYNPVRVSLRGSIRTSRSVYTDAIRSTRNSAESGLKLLNVTNYYSDILPALNPYDPKSSNPTFEYLHDGRHVYFSETFNNSSQANYKTNHGDAKITVDYSYLVSGIRVKIILRRTSYAHPSVTPLVLDYTLRSRCLQ